MCFDAHARGMFSSRSSPAMSAQNKRRLRTRIAGQLLKRKKLLSAAGDCDYSSLPPAPQSAMAGMSTRTDDPDNSHIMYNHVDCAVSEFELSESVSENSESSSESESDVSAEAGIPENSITSESESDPENSTTNDGLLLELESEYSTTDELESDDS